MKNMTKSDQVVKVIRTIKASEIKAVYTDESGKRYIKEGKRYVSIEGHPCIETIKDSKTFWSERRLAK